MHATTKTLGQQSMRASSEAMFQKNGRKKDGLLRKMGLKRTRGQKSFHVLFCTLDHDDAPMNRVVEKVWKLAKHSAALG
jgi:hypothetical protein